MKSWSMKQRELVGMSVGLLVSAAALVIAVVVSGNYEDLGDRSVPFVYAPAAATLGVGAALAIADRSLVPDFLLDLLKGTREWAGKIYRS